MGLQIEDGKGSGNNVEVNSDKQLVVLAITKNELKFVSQNKGLAFSWASGTYDPDAGDTILLVKNTSATKELHIKSITLSCDTETRAVVHLPTTDVTVTGTTITGTNLNAASSNVAEASAAKDETGNSQGNIVWRS